MPLNSRNFRLNRIVTTAPVASYEFSENRVMRPTPLPTARHARLFELIRQINLAEQRREMPLPADVTVDDTMAFARRAAQTLAARG